MVRGLAFENYTNHIGVGFLARTEQELAGVFVPFVCEQQLCACIQQVHNSVTRAYARTHACTHVVKLVPSERNSCVILFASVQHFQHAWSAMQMHAIGRAQTTGTSSMLSSAACHAHVCHVRQCICTHCEDMLRSKRNPEPWPEGSNSLLGGGQDLTVTTECSSIYGVHMHDLQFISRSVACA